MNYFFKKTKTIVFFKLKWNKVYSHKSMFVSLIAVFKFCCIMHHIKKVWFVNINFFTPPLPIIELSGPPSPIIELRMHPHNWIFKQVPPHNRISIDKPSPENRISIDTPLPCN